jgi:hypothetical protein
VTFATKEFNPPVAQQDWPEPNEHLYLTLRNSPRGDTSKTATLCDNHVEVRYKFEKILLLVSISSETSYVITATVAAFDILPQGLSRNITTRNQVFGREHHVKKDSTFFSH